MARRRPAGRGSTYEEGGRWRAQLVVDGRKHRRWADTQAQAEALLDRMREQTLAGVRPQHLTVGDYLEHYLSEIVRRNRAPSTAAGYASKVRLYILSAIGRVRLDQLTPQHVRRMLGTMQDRGLRPNSSRQVRAILSGALREAERDGLVTRNVARLTQAPTVPFRERRALTLAEAERFLEAVRGREDEAFYLLGVTGLRQSEAVGLRWRDVDLEAALLNVRQTIQRVQGAWVVGTPKARSERLIPMPAFVAERLAARRDQQPPELVSLEWRELVFTRPDTGEPLNGPTMTHRLYRLLRRASLPTIAYHDLRHSAATILHALGVDRRDIQALLGHASITTTMDIYTHVDGDRLRQAVGRLDAWHSEAGSP